MNRFGRIFQIALFGESHGEEVGVVIDGCPAGLPLSADDFSSDLKRRLPESLGTTPRKEPDTSEIQSGLFNGRTTGAPLMIVIKNKDVRSKDYLALRNIPRPGHSDLVAFHKFSGFNDYRGSGHFSGRLTAALVVAGGVAKKILHPIWVKSTLLEADGYKEVKKAIQAAIEEGDSIGGLVECRAGNMPVGLGEPFFDSVESLLSHIVFAIPGIKGIEFGSGFKSIKMKGSEYNDAILDANGRTRTNHAGGINGGLTNGNELVFRVAVRPPSSIKKKQQTVNLRTGEKVNLSVEGRHDACIALRMPVIVEAATAIVLTDFMLIEQKIPRIMREEDGSAKNSKND